MGPALQEQREGRVHVVAQFTFDDPTMPHPGEDLVRRYDLSFCGSYMDGDSGFANGHCFGLPAEQVEQFAADTAVRAVRYRGTDWTLPAGIRDRMEDGNAARLLVRGYPDQDLTPAQLQDRAGVQASRAGERWLLTAPVDTYDAVRRIAALEQVSWVQPLRRISTAVDVGRQQIGAADVNGPEGRTGGETGNGSLIGVLDTGIQFNHSHFADITVINSSDWVDGSPPPDDAGSHGTHVSGTITGRSSDGGRVLTGVAPDADLVVAAGFDADSWAYVSSNVLPYGRFDQMAQDAPSDMDAISNSWGSADGLQRASPFTRYGPIAKNADKWAYDNRDTLLVFSNGNACDRDPTRKTNRIGCAAHVPAPALGKNVLSVGATYENGIVSPLNDLNPPEDVVDLNNGRVKPDVLAPGEAIRATVPVGQYEDKRGTSMATPHVSGAVALLAERWPTMDANMMRALLIATTSPVRNPHNVLAGYGEVDVDDALGTPNNYESVQRHLSGTIRKTGTPGSCTTTTDTYTVTVPRGAHRLDAVLSWMDPQKTAGGTKGFIFNRLDLELEAPSGATYRKTNPANVKKLSIPRTDLEAGQWTVRVVGANVGAAFNPGCVDKQQAYDAVVRVVTDRPAVNITVDGHDPATLSPTSLHVANDSKTRFTVTANGTGAPVQDLIMELNVTGTGLQLCGGTDARRNQLDGDTDIQAAEAVTASYCVRPRPNTSAGPHNLTLLATSTNGAHTSTGSGTLSLGTGYTTGDVQVDAARYTVPMIVGDGTHPTPPSNVTARHATFAMHTGELWTADTTFNFTWDPATDTGVGIDGYLYDLVWASRSAPQPGQDPRIGNRTWATVTATNARSGHEYTFQVRAVDRGGRTSTTATSRDFHIDITPPETDEQPRLGRLPLSNGKVQFYQPSMGTPNYTIPTSTARITLPGYDGHTAVDRWRITATQQGDSSPYLTRTVTEQAANKTVTPFYRHTVLTGLRPGTQLITVTPVDQVGNTGNDTANTVCVQNPQGTACTKQRPGSTGGPGTTINTTPQLDVGDLCIAVGASNPSTGAGTGCTFNPSTGPQITGSGIAKRFAGDEQVTIRVKQADGGTRAAHATIRNGTLTAIGPGPHDSPSLRVTMNSTTYQHIATADDFRAAARTQYERGAITVTGVGPINRLKTGLLTAAKDLQDFTRTTLGGFL